MACCYPKEGLHYYASEQRKRYPDEIVNIVAHKRKDAEGGSKQAANVLFVKKFALSFSFWQILRVLMNEYFKRKVYKSITFEQAISLSLYLTAIENR